MNRTLALLTAATALAACTTAVSAPAPNSGWDWRMQAQEDTATLSFSAGPDRKLEFECHGGQDAEMSMMAWLPVAGPAAQERGDKPHELILIAGGKRQIYPTLTETNLGRWEMMGHVRKTDPVIVAFRERGRLSLKIHGRTERLIPTHGDSAVAEFFEWCH